MTSTRLVSICSTIAMLVLGMVAVPSFAVTTTEKCAADQLKTAGKYALCRLATQAKAVKRGEAPDFTKCEDKFSGKWQKAAAKARGSCPLTSDELAVEWTLRDEVDELASQIIGLEPELPPADPWDWPEATVLAVEIDIDPDTASAVLPAGVTLTTPPVATVFVRPLPQQCLLWPLQRSGRPGCT